MSIFNFTLFKLPSQLAPLNRKGFLLIELSISILFLIIMSGMLVHYLILYQQYAQKNRDYLEALNKASSLLAYASVDRRLFEQQLAIDKNFQVTKSSKSDSFGLDWITVKVKKGQAAVELTKAID